MNTLVIDASIAVKWVVEEEGTSQALTLRQVAKLTAPELLVAECANIFWKKVQREELSRQEALFAARLLQAAEIELVPTRSLLEVATRIAIDLDHPAYDCLYLALAVATQCESLRPISAFYVRSLTLAPYYFPIELEKIAILDPLTMEIPSGYKSPFRYVRDMNLPIFSTLEPTFVHGFRTPYTIATNVSKRTIVLPMVRGNLPTQIVWSYDDVTIRLLELVYVPASLVSPITAVEIDPIFILTRTSCNSWRTIFFLFNHSTAHF